jgi:hypothetical protein
MLPHIYPCIIKSYDGAKRTCRIEIPSITDGAETLPEAQIMNMIGDKSEHTEIRILPNDRAYCTFLQGDPRYPLIIGFRPKNTGNEVGTRKWHHDNVQLDADQVYTVNAGDRITLNVGGTLIRIESGQVTVDSANSKFTGNVVIDGSLNVAQVTTTGGLSSTGTAGGVSLSGNVSASGGTFTHNGVSVGSSHVHGGVQTGGGTTSTPS